MSCFVREGGERLLGQVVERVLVGGCEAWLAADEVVGPITDYLE